MCVWTTNVFRVHICSCLITWFDNLVGFLFSAFEGTGIELIDLLCSALSTLSRLLQLWPLDATKSPIAQTLSVRPVGRTERHLVTTIAQYIYHRVNPQLPRLATQLLTALASVSN